jgi:ESS family glutamate:Na+ symporter
MRLDPLSSLLAALAGCVVGTLLNRRIGLLARYNIPDPITGGLLFAASPRPCSRAAAGRWRSTRPSSRCCCCCSSRASAWGRTCAAQAWRQGAGDLPGRAVPVHRAAERGGRRRAPGCWTCIPIFGLVSGSITLVGGHGTGAAYAERFADVHNLQSVMDLIMTVATPAWCWAASSRARRAVPDRAPRPAVRGGAGCRGGRRARRAGQITTVGVVGALAGMIAAVLAGRWLASEFSGGVHHHPGLPVVHAAGVTIRNVGPFLRCASTIAPRT